MNLRIDLDPRVLRDQLLGNGDALQDRDALLHDRVVFHVAHAEHAIDLGDAQPVQDIRHQRLEAHVLDAGDVLRALKVLVGAIGAAFARVVDEVLRHLAQRAALLAEVDDDAGAAGLRFFDRLLDPKDQVGATGADVTAEDVGAVAFWPGRRSSRRSVRRWGVGIA